ncbi:TetR/AcrR family transcriptional regulator [Cryobacterium sp. SO1]|uniref:TetR/AcrR family transcriptional regulator n=1 Tax=Cryobacterium sp. SO1 TaxID=1897061 RepID=UPI0010237462|nr:TetR/AcrR family transcriptional regulator [Cryobacterium sp. SO1]RZI35581.1 Nucleoid occlusion factor SlmA [Cryobacterium sp. SO1]
MSEENSQHLRRQRRERSSVSTDEILQASEVVARGGFDALTMRAVATQMGASPMALYRYFATKDELVDAMLDRVLGRIELKDATDDWLADLAGFATAHRAVLADHPWAIVPLFTHSNPGINATIIGEAALGILERGRVAGGEAVAIFCGILALNYGWFAFTAARDTTRMNVEPEAVLATALSMLPADHFPLTLSVADQLSNYGSDAHYAFALQALIDGVGATAQPK